MSDIISLDHIRDGNMPALLDVEKLNIEKKNHYI